MLPAPREIATENKNFSQCETSRTFQINVFKILDNKNIEKISWTKLIPVLIHLKYNFPHLEFRCLPHHP